MSQPAARSLSMLLDLEVEPAGPPLQLLPPVRPLLPMPPAPDMEDARRVLHHHWGYDDFRPGQSDALRAVLAGRDVLAVLPTGAGKSIVYQVPALLRRGLTVVVSPLISLMKDQIDGLLRRDVPCAFINSSLSPRAAAERLRAAEEGTLKLLYVAPERFDSIGFRERIRHVAVSLLAIDEAHCVSHWGHDFRRAYIRLGQQRELLGNPQVLALTATATPQVRRDIISLLGFSDPAVIVTSFDRPNLRWRVERATSQEAKARMLAAEFRGLGEGPEPEPERAGIGPAMLGETIDRFLRQVTSDLAAKTADTYGIACAQLERHFGVARRDDEERTIIRDVAIRDIPREEALEWLKEPKETTGGRPWGAQKQSVAHAVASQLWQMALVQEEDEAERTDRPWKPWRNFWAADRQRPKATVRPAKKRTTRHAFLSRQRAAALLRANKGTPRAAWVAIGFYAGLRVAETANLRATIDLDFVGRRILVQARKGDYPWHPKNRKDRDVPMNTALGRWLRRHIRDGFAATYLFHPDFADRPYSEQHWPRITREAFEGSGIRYGGRKGDALSYHSLRHTCASWLAMRGYSPNLIAEILGDTVEIVLRTYIHLFPSDKTRAMEALRRKSTL